MKKIKIAILISGRGSNMKALIEACKEKDFPAQIELVISNKKEALGLKEAQKNGIKTKFINHKDFLDRESFDKEMLKEIDQHNCQFVCLAGFMRILSSYFVTKLKGKLINIHPSLLPSFKGANAVRDALNYGVKFSGCSVHFVEEEVDSGEIIEQEIVSVLDDDDENSLAARILQKEHVIYPKALRKICNQLIKND